MLMVLLSGLTAVSSTSAGLRNQYLNKLSSTASQAGVAYGKACIKKNSGAITWSNAQPLKPNTDCTGTEFTSCPLTSTAAACYVVNNSSFRTSFSVGVATDPGNIKSITSQGTVYGARTSNAVMTSRSTTSVKAVLSAAAGSLYPVGTMKNIVSIDDPSNSQDSSSVLCGLSNAGQIWCSGYYSGGAIDYQYNQAQGATYDYRDSIGYLGGKVYCSSDATFSSTVSCTSATAKYFLSNLSDATQGIFKNTTYTQLMAYTFNITDGTLARPDALCAISSSSQVFCAGIDVSGADSISYAGGSRTIDGRRYRTNLSDPTNGVFKGSNATSITMFDKFRYTSEGYGYSPAPSICITKDTGAVSCAGYAVAETVSCSFFCFDVDPFVQYSLPYSMGPATCSVNPSMSPTRACTITQNTGTPIFYVSDLTNATNGIFKGKSMKSLMDYDMFISNVFNTNSIPHAICGVTTAGDVWCASFNGTTNSFDSLNYNWRLAYGTTHTCSTSLTMSPTSSCGSSTSKYFLSNISASGEIFNGKTVSKLISPYRYNASVTNYPAAMCALQTNGKVNCIGEIILNIGTGTPDQLAGPEPAYAFGSAQCSGSPCSTAGNWYSGFWDSDLSANSIGVFSGKTIVDITRSGSTSPYSLCATTSVGEVLCGVHSNATSSPGGTAVGNALTYNGGTRSGSYLTNLSASPGGVFSITGGGGSYNVSGPLLFY